MAKTTMTTVLAGFVEAERNYRQTLQRSAEPGRYLASSKRLTLYERAVLHSDGSDQLLSESDELALREDLERMAECEWTVNELTELLHRYQGVDHKVVCS